MPVAVSFGPLLPVIQRDSQVLTKDLELYAGDAPPADYGLDAEVEGIRRVADTAGWWTVHLVGYSGGGAASLAFAARYPQRLLSLALIEPAWIGNRDWSPEEQAYWAEMGRIMTLPPDQRLPVFIRAALRPGVEFSSPPGPPPPWMEKRPAGVAALNKAFRQGDLDLEDFRTFRQPVYLTIGSLSSVVEERKAQRLGRYFPHLSVEVYEGLHHFNPPQRAQPERLASALRALWSQAAAPGDPAGVTP
jgi:pimeloyl-ACP methyl ester carboxylesterase